MRCLLLISICFITVITGGKATAQLSLFRDFEPLQSDALRLYYCTDTSSNRSIEQLQRIAPQLRRWQGERFPLSKTNRMLWLVIDLSSVPDSWKLQYLLVRNPHINYLYSWLLQNDSLVLTHPPTGDKFAFSTRRMNQPDFSMEWADVVHTKANRWVLLLDKRYEVNNVPLHFFSQQGLFSLNRTRGILFGLILGIMLFILIFNLFLFFSMKEWLYVSYGLFILFSLFYQFSDAGFAFMYLFPNQPFFTDLVRPFSATMSTLFYFLFLLLLLDVRHNMPNLFRAFIAFLLLYALLHFLTLPLLPNATGLRITLHNVWTVFQLLIIVCGVVLLFLSLHKRIPFTGYALASALILISCSMGYSAFVAGNLPDTYFTRNLYLIGILAEILLLSFMLSIRFRRYKDDSEQLSRKMQDQQELIFKTVTDHQQRELERVSQMLHDTVGARLSAIRLNLERAANGAATPLLQQSIQQVGQLAGTVRDLSHALSPVMLEQQSLQQLVQEYIGFLNQNGRLQVQLDWMGDTDTLPFRYKLMTHTLLQELLQNIIKHADATEAIVQVICTAEMVSIFVEDNGRGYDSDAASKGLGLTQIQKLLYLTGGRFDIKNKTEGGTAVSLEFPVQTKT